MALIKCSECGKEISDKAVTCIHCGYNIKEHLLKQEQEKAKAEQERLKKEAELQREQQKKQIYNQFFGTPKKKFIACSVVILTILIIVTSCIIFQTITKDFNEIKTATENTELLYYEWNSDFNDLLYDIDHNDKWLDISYESARLSLKEADESAAILRGMYSSLKDSDKAKYQKYLGGTLHTTWEQLDEKYIEHGMLSKNEAEYLEQIHKDIVAELVQKDKEINGEVSIADKSLTRDGNYFDFVVTFENTTPHTVDYIKYTVYLYDEDGNTIHSDWSNWSGTLKTNAKVQTDTMIDYVSGCEKFSVSIDEIS